MTIIQLVGRHICARSGTELPKFPNRSLIGDASFAVREGGARVARDALTALLPRRCCESRFRKNSVT